MSRIEGEAKPILTRPIQGDPVTLHRADMLAAATWAYKTGLIADLLSGRVAGPRTFAHLYEHRRPPDSVAILMGCYGGNRFPLYAGSRSITFDMGIDDGPRTQRDAYLLTVGVGHVVFQVFGHHFQPVFDLHPSSWKSRTSVVIWPQRDHPVRWPPPVPLTDNTLMKFARDL